MGGGRVITQFSPSSLEEYRGFGAIVQRQIYLKNSKLRVFLGQENLFKAMC
jgi:hypothetical protein